DPVLQAIPSLRVCGQLGTDHEQLPLAREQSGGETLLASGVQLRTGKAQRGDRLVDRAVGLCARIVLGYAPAVEQAGRAVIAPPRGDRAARNRGAAAAHQTRPASRGSQRSASKVTLTSC